MTVTLVELATGEVEIAGYVIRGRRVYGNVPLLQELKKVLDTPAVVVGDDGTISLLCEMRSELIDQSAAVVWHRTLLAKLR
ncbi:MAG TPA: hypothetical protein VMM16_10810 [Verrucomicrobiae bacterium]|nr:hypothetical protein [Verrucomicrobiae bacterium]